MTALIHIIEVYGLWVVFFSVLLDQGGLPTPSYAPIIVTAALTTEAEGPLLPILIVATFAAVLADVAWFAGGRRFGPQLLRLMCKLSLSPDSCVGTTRRVYEKWGAPSLILAKYIPGFAAVSTVLAGQAGTSWRRFLVYDAIGALLWASGAVILGAVFHEAVEALLATLEGLGYVAIAMLIVGAAIFVAYKWWQPAIPARNPNGANFDGRIAHAASGDAGDRVVGRAQFGESCALRMDPRKHSCARHFRVESRRAGRSRRLLRLPQRRVGRCHCKKIESTRIQARSPSCRRHLRVARERIPGRGASAGPSACWLGVGNRFVGQCTDTTMLGADTPFSSNASTATWYSTPTLSARTSRLVPPFIEE